MIRWMNYSMINYSINTNRTIRNMKRLMIKKMIMSLMKLQ